MNYWSTARPVRRNRAVSPEMIARSAAALLDEEGYGNVSLRLLADRLGAAPASLYSRISSLSDAHDLALDYVLSVDRVVQRAVSDGGVIDILLGLYRHLLSHPWAIQILAARPPRGPFYLEASEALLMRLQQTGIANPLASGYAATNLVIGSALTQQAADREPREFVDGQVAPMYKSLHFTAELHPETVLRDTLTCLLGAMGGTPAEE